MQTNLRTHIMIRTLITLSLILSLSACQTPPQNNPKTLAERYTQAVEDASVATPYEISNDLIPINKKNNHLIWNDSKSKLKVVTWKSEDSYVNNIANASETSDKEKYVIWVTSAPQVQNFCRDYLLQNPHTSADDLDLRLKQYLGLNQNWKYDTFIELWVDPNDLFRPCVDPEINDSSCNLAFSDDPTKAVEIPGIANYKHFYQNLYFNDFRFRQTGTPTPGVPWTGLGYTYDWGNPNTPVGASEFIITTKAPYTIASTASTMEYCQVP